MSTLLRRVPVIALALAALACNLPGVFGTPTPEFTALETAAQQTLTARLTQGAPTATLPGGAPTAGAPAATTAPAIATPLPTAAPPTAAVDFQATAAAQALSATQSALGATQTALAPRPLPPIVISPQPIPPQPIPPQPGPDTGRIRFAAGATSGEVSGQLSAAGAAGYLVAAGSGQTMLASVYSPNNNVFLGVAGVADGITLLRSAARLSSFTGVLPATQDYRLSLAGPAGSTFTLQAIIPARIQFAPGAISAAVPGNLAGGQVNYYLAQARQGQVMSARILSPYNDIFLTIYGMTDGSPLVRSVMGLTTWSGVLPLTQDYMIQAVSTGGTAGYTLEITIQ